MSFQAYLDTIEGKTGLTPRQLVELAGQQGFADPSVKAGTILDWHRDDSDTLWLDGKATKPAP